MSARQIESKVETMVLELLNDQDLIELVDVEYVKEHDWYLRVYIDKEGGIDIDDCQNLSVRLEKVLDQEDFLSEAYTLEVSSPGLDRVLRKDRDFVREMGKMVDISLYAPIEGEKVITGTMVAYDGEKIVLDDGRVINKEDFSQVRLHIDF